MYIYLPSSALFIIIAIALAFAFAYIFFLAYKLKRTFDIMEKMLDSALIDKFNADSYNETRLSRMEQKLERFIMMSKTSRSNITEERDKIKSLISDISHQTKTPVSNILLYSQLLKKQHIPNQKSNIMIDEIIAQSEKLNFLVQSLIKISRLETGIIQVSPQKNQLCSFLNTIAKDVSEYANSKNISIEISCDESIYTQFDPKWTREAVYNIVDNAVKYTKNSGSVKISVTKYEFFCRIDISDNGIGISEDEYGKIFARFYRSPSVSQYEGVGIGLYISREIVLAQGGYIKVCSSYDKGSVFSVFLPNESKT